MSTLKVNQIRGKLQAMFEPHLDVKGLELAIATLRFFSITDHHLLPAIYRRLLS